MAASIDSLQSLADRVARKYAAKIVFSKVSTDLASLIVGPEVSIGDGAVVRGSVPPCAIVSGNPAQVVGWRDREQFLALQAREAFN